MTNLTNPASQVISTNVDYKKLALDWIQNSNTKLNDNEIQQFIMLCQMHGLNPFKREVYAIKYGNNFNIVVGYEVYVKRALNSGLCNGFNTTFDKDSQGGLKCTATVYRRGMQHPIVHTCYLNEVKQNNSMWNTKPRMMLEKTTISQGLRRAFGDVIDGLPYTREEMPEGDVVGTPQAVTQDEPTPTVTEAVPATSLPDAEEVF